MTNIKVRKSLDNFRYKLMMVFSPRQVQISHFVKVWIISDINVQWCPHPAFHQPET